MQTGDPIWQAFSETGDPLWYLLYRQQRTKDEQEERKKQEPQALD